MAYKWKPSKSAARAFAQQMREIEDYCIENNISSSYNNDSYYFTINGQNYRVSNHSVEASRRNSGGKYHQDGRSDEVIYIHASKSRLIEIHQALLRGEKLDGNGN